MKWARACWRRSSSYIPLTNALSLLWVGGLVGNAEGVPSRLLLMLPFVVLGG